MWLHICQNLWNTTPRVNPDVRNGLWVIMIEKCRFSNVINVPLWQGVYWWGEGCVCVGQRAPGNSAHFYCEPKLALKNKNYLEGKTWKEMMQRNTHTHTHTFPWSRNLNSETFWMSLALNKFSDFRAVWVKDVYW